MNLELILFNLSKAQKAELSQLLSCDDMNEHSRFENGRFCPHCKHNKPIKKGVIKKHQRFYCPNCQKYFTAYAETILNYTKKEITTWKMFVKMMFNSNHISLKDVAEQLHIHSNTAFRWRHKIMNVLEQKFMNDNLGGIK